MDGLLIDSEDLYSLVTNTILERYDRPPLPWSIKAQLQGRPGPQAGEIFHAWAQLPISHEQYLAEQKELQTKLFPTCKPLPGVLDLLAELKAVTQGTSSSRVHIYQSCSRTLHPNIKSLVTIHGYPPAAANRRQTSTSSLSRRSTKLSKHKGNR
jgi:beta-phosphoglucomutase-like phosphatase (HAD superfamily)